MLKNIWVRIAVGLLIVLLVGITIAYQCLGFMVRKGITTVGPTLTGCPISLQSVSVRLLRGELALTGLVVGNPAGYTADSALALGKIRVAFDPRSVLGPVFRVTEVTVEAPEITYELGLGGSNLGTILAKVEAFGGKAEGQAATPSAKPGKKVVIDLVTVKDAKVRLASSLASGIVAPVSLPDVVIRDIGRGEQGAGLDEATRLILTEVLTSVKGIASQAGATLDAVKGAGAAAKEGAGGVLKGVKGLLGGKSK
jgi:hypothetical protein